MIVFTANSIISLLSSITLAFLGVAAKIAI
jgi:hypothetical protein